MIKLPAMLSVCLLATAAPVAAQTIDLSDPSALEQVRASNPEHFEKVALIVAGLREQPRRAESDWLEVSYGAKEVDLASPVLTSSPPQQLLQFTLDDVRYRLTLARSDMVRTLNERLRTELQTRPRDQTLLR